MLHAFFDVVFGENVNDSKVEDLRSVEVDQSCSILLLLCVCLQVAERLRSLMAVIGLEGQGSGR